MPRTWQTLFLAPLVLAALPAVALAQVHGEQGNELPMQFDLGIWTIVIFVVLFLVLRWAAWKPMVEGLRKREDAIRGSVEEARHTRAEMEQLRTKFRAEMEAAYAEIPKL